MLKPLKIDGIQIIPCDVTSNKGDVYDNYYYIHVYKHISALDTEKSKCQKMSMGNLYSISSLILNEAFLATIPLKERLVFKLDEDTSIELYHKSVVDAIMATKPTGVKFSKAEGWSL